MTKKLFILIVIAGLFSCRQKKKNNEPEAIDTYDKSAMLVNMADNVIIPAYNNFKTSLDSLTLEYNNFKTSGLLTDFQTVKQKLNVAYLRYQRISLLEFGPAETIMVRTNFNVFPTDTVQIRSNITVGTYTLDAANNLDAKGFPALDYLFYGLNMTEASCVSQFTSSANQKQYVSDLLNDMSLKLNSVLSSWTSSYRNTFVNSTGNNVGSSVGYMVNQMNYELDLLKNAKIGIPLGKQTLGIAIPEKCEAFYGAQSVRYTLETLNAIEYFYYGNSGEGLDNYVNHVGALSNGEPLNNVITNQFFVARSKLTAIANPLSSQVVVNASTVDAAYVELVKLLVLLKTDLPSSLGVVITYQDNDGD